jgi:hypothetical protein
VGTVISPAVAEIDPAHEGAIQLGPASMAKYDELLVVGATGPDPHVEQADATCRVDLLSEMSILPLGELQAIEM